MKSLFDFLNIISCVYGVHFFVFPVSQFVPENYSFKGRLAARQNACIMIIVDDLQDRRHKEKRASLTGGPFLYLLQSIQVSGINKISFGNTIKRLKTDSTKPQPNERLFEVTKYYLNHEMRRDCEKSGVRKIRVHDLRHSHASLLIEMGCDPLLIKERLGHEKIQTTLNTYSHLYPNKQSEVASKLGKIMSKRKPKNKK